MSLLTTRWRSRRLTAEAKHALIVRVRPGHMQHGYLGSTRIDTGASIYPPLIWKGQNINCWKAVWTPDGPWQELPQIENAKWGRDFDIQTGKGRGTATATVAMVNVGYPAQTGVAGIYHNIDRGYFSPTRGITLTTRPQLWNDQPNEWKNALNGGWQIEIWEGYGQGDDVKLLETMVDNSYAPPSGALSRTFTGIIVECDGESNPDRITLTARDFGIYLTDAEIMGNNKAPEIRSPVTFADRRRTQGQEKITGPLASQSGSVVNGTWTSAPQGASTDTQWEEITSLPAGYYEDFFVAPEFGGMTMDVSIYCNGTGTMDRTTPIPSGWITLSGSGTGTTPDGTPYIMTATVPHSPTRRWSFGHGFDLPAGSRLRITWTNLWPDGSGQYHAGSDELATYRFGSDPLHPPAGAAPVNAKGWILVDDAADVVTMLLIWAGFREWKVVDFGWTLMQPRIYSETKMFMDIINDMLQQGSYIFYMGAPTNDDRSIGVPHFEPASALSPSTTGMIDIRDTDMTEQLETKWDMSGLPYVIRYRGAITKDGYTLFQDLARRFMATYYPPWSGGWKQSGGSNDSEAFIASAFGQQLIPRTAGLIRHFAETMGLGTIVTLNSNEECLFACVLAGIQYALNMATATCQVPGVSGIELNHQINVFDRAQAVNTRLWVASIASEHQMGRDGYWRINLGGSMLDTYEMAVLRLDYDAARQNAQRIRSGW